MNNDKLKEEFQDIKCNITYLKDRIERVRQQKNYLLQAMKLEKIDFFGTFNLLEYALKKLNLEEMHLMGQHKIQINRKIRIKELLYQ